MNIMHSILVLDTSSLVGSAQADTITVRPQRPMRNATGGFGCTFWNQVGESPIDSAKAAQQAGASISGNQAKHVFKDEEAGKHAISVLHDENDDKKMEGNYVGAPKEGHGFSNEAKPKNQQTASFGSAALQCDGANKNVQLMVLTRRSQWIMPMARQKLGVCNVFAV